MPFPRVPRVDWTIFRAAEANIPLLDDPRFIGSEDPEPPEQVQAVCINWMEPQWLYWVRVDGGWQSTGVLVKYPALLRWDSVGVDGEGVRHDLADITIWLRAQQ